ncbi:MAG TPA: hypothetical protein VF121_02775 [Thermoanaerobaculia bacterium]|nr:hypothetical protein [Thermoanaerobaculia bacterium]
MTGSEKFTWGVVLSVAGSLGFVGGIVLSMTLIGACLGIPMALISLPFMIWGTVWAYQGHFQKAQEVLSAGIREGLSAAQTASLQPLSRVAVAASGRPAELAASAPSAEDSVSARPLLPEAGEAQGDEGTAPETPSAQRTAGEDQHSGDDPGR